MGNTQSSGHVHNAAASIEKRTAGYEGNENGYTPDKLGTPISHPQQSATTTEQQREVVEKGPTNDPVNNLQESADTPPALLAHVVGAALNEQ
jgi:hypothetical protein